MTIFRKFEIMLQAVSLDEFISRLGRHVKGGWARDEAQEQHLRQFAPVQNRQFCFTLQDGARYSPVSVWLVAKSPAVLSVANILSRSVDLSVEDFNTVLENFVNLVAKPAVDEGGADATFTPDEVQLDDLLPPEVAEKLRRFSHTANKLTGSLHPGDFDRWLDFLTEAHRHGCTLPADLLGRWLLEEEGWPPDTVAQLTTQYEFGEGLLHSYDRKKVG